MKIVKSSFCIIIVLAMIATLFSCNGSKPDSSTVSATDTESPVDPGNTGSNSDSQDDWVSIKIGVTGSLGRFIAGTSPSESLMGCDVVYNTIFDIDPITKQNSSTILDEWYKEDDTTLIMKLKQGIYFSNGDEATAEDLLFSYLQHEERGSEILRSARIKGDMCEVRDKYTVAIKFELPFGTLPNYTNYLFDKAWAQSVGWDSEEWYNPVGSGPYYVYEYTSDDHMTLRLRDDYWDKENSDYYVDEWIIRYYPDASTMNMDLELGNIAWCPATSNDYSRFLSQGVDNVEITAMDKGVPAYICFDYIGNPIWSDKAIRQAIAYGIDWDAIGVLDKGEMFKPLSSIISSGSPFHINPGKYEYDLDKAKQILSDAGYEQNDIKLHIYTMDTQRYKNIAEGFQFYCSQLGIDVDVEYGDIPSALAKWQVHGESDVGFMEYYVAVPSHDPLYPVSGILTGFAWHIIPDTISDNIQEQVLNAIYCSDPDLQMQRYKELQQLLFDEVLLIPYAQGVEAYGYRTDVFSKDQMDSFVKTATYLWLSRIGRADAWS